MTFAPRDALHMTSKQVSSLLVGFRQEVGDVAERVRRRQFLDGCYKNMGYERFSEIPANRWNELLNKLEVYRASAALSLAAKEQQVFIERVKEFLTTGDVSEFPARKTFLRGVLDECGFERAADVTPGFYPAILKQFAAYDAAEKVKHAERLKQKEEAARAELRRTAREDGIVIPIKRTGTVEQAMAVLRGAPKVSGYIVGVPYIPRGARIKPAQHGKDSPFYTLDAREIPGLLKLTPDQTERWFDYLEEGLPMTDDTAARAQAYEDAASREPLTLDTLAQEFGKRYTTAATRIHQTFDDLEKDVTALEAQAVADGLPKHMISAIHNAASGATMQEAILKVLRTKKSASTGS